MENITGSYLRFLAGDNSGLTEVIAAYKDGLVLYLTGFVGNIAIAEELTEETFVKLVLKRPSFYQNSAFKTWIYSIARNTAIDYLRRNRRADIPLEEAPQLADEANLERTYIQQEKKIFLHRCMKQLKPEYRQVLWLAYFEEFSYREIARILRKTTHSVETLAYRARLALKSILIKEGFEYEEL